MGIYTLWMGLIQYLYNWYNSGHNCSWALQFWRRFWNPPHQSSRPYNVSCSYGSSYTSYKWDIHSHMVQYPLVISTELTQ